MNVSTATYLFGDQLIRIFHIAACEYAQRVAHLNPSPSLQVAIDTKRRWIDGEATGEELEEACSAVFESIEIRSEPIKFIPYEAGYAVIHAAQTSALDALTDSAAAAVSAVKAASFKEKMDIGKMAFVDAETAEKEAESAEIAAQIKILMKLLVTEWTPEVTP